MAWWCSPRPCASRSLSYSTFSSKPDELEIGEIDDEVDIDIVAAAAAAAAANHGAASSAAQSGSSAAGAQPVAPPRSQRAFLLRFLCGKTPTDFDIDFASSVSLPLALQVQTVVA